MQEYSSKLLENTVNQIAKLPGIGKRTAIRLALHLLKQSKEEVALFTSAIDELKNNNDKRLPVCLKLYQKNSSRRKYFV